MGPGASSSIARDNEDTESFGLFQFEASIQPPSKDETFPLDFVAIHGLNGNYSNTWTHKTSGCNWLKDILPNKFPGARIFSYGYNAIIYKSRGKGSLQDFASTLLAHLAGERANPKDKKRKIIFICHSMGGIVLKQALSLADGPDKFDYGELLKSTFGIVFLATPHRGSDKIDLPVILSYILRVASKVSGDLLPTMRDDLLKTLVKDCEGLINLGTNTRNLLRDIKVVSFFEENAMGPPINSVIVDKASAVLQSAGERQISMAGCDHTTICRFRDESTQSFKLVLGILVGWANEVQEVNLNEISALETACLQTLWFKEMYDRKLSIEDRMHPGTCQWISENMAYREWLKQPQGFLWIKGKPGAGKSTALAFTRKIHEDNGTELQKTETGMFRSFLYQLAMKVQTVRSRLVDTFNERKTKRGIYGRAWTWNPIELKTLFIELIVSIASSQSVTLFIDALDEAGYELGFDLAQFFQNLQMQFVETGCTARICISCRHYPAFVSWTGCSYITIEHENDGDIATYCLARLTACNDPIIGPFFGQDRDKIEREIGTRASGVFQWARLALRLVERLYHKGESTGHIMKHLASVPLELSKIYEEILIGLSIDDRPRGLLLMQWVLFAVRPLSVQELRFAVASDVQLSSDHLQSFEGAASDQQANNRMRLLIKNLFGGLLEVKDRRQDTVVEFVHETVPEFLRSGGLYHLASVSNSSPSELSTLSDTGEFTAESHQRLAFSCIRYLKRHVGDVSGATQEDFMQEGGVDLGCPPQGMTVSDAMFNQPKGICSQLQQAKEETSKALQILPLLEYSCASWFLHTAKAEAASVKYFSELSEFDAMLASDLLESWWMIFHAAAPNNAEFDSMYHTLLSIGSPRKLSNTAHFLLDHKFMPFHQDKRPLADETPLLRAIDWNHAELVQRILDGCEDRKLVTGDRTRRWDAIEYAATRGHRDLLRLLLLYLEKTDNRTYNAGNVNLPHILARVGMALLAFTHIDVLYKYFVAVCSKWLARYRLSSQYSILQDPPKLGAIVDERAMHCRENVLEPYPGSLSATYNTDFLDDIVQLIIDYYLRRHPRVYDEDNPAIENEFLAGDGRLCGTPLQAAVDHGSFRDVQRLLDWGMDPNCTKNACPTALCRAVGRVDPCEGIINILLEAGAKVNFSCHHQETEDLCEEGCGYHDMNYPRTGTTVLCNQLENHEDCCFNARLMGMKACKRPLQWAAQHGDSALAIVKLLIDRGAYINAPGSGSLQAALVAAIRSGCGSKIMKLLLETGADVNVPGQNVLATAAVAPDGEMAVTLILEKRDDIHQTELVATGMRPEFEFRRQRMEGKRKISDLVWNIPNQSSYDRDRIPPLAAVRVSAFVPRRSVIELLIKGGADVNQGEVVDVEALDKSDADQVEFLIPLREALRCKEKCPDIVHLLRSNNAHTGMFLGQPLEALPFAILASRTDIADQVVQVLLKTPTTATFTRGMTKSVIKVVNKTRDAREVVWLLLDSSPDVCPTQSPIARMAQGSDHDGIPTFTRMAISRVVLGASMMEIYRGKSSTLIKATTKEETVLELWQKLIEDANEADEDLFSDLLATTGQPMMFLYHESVYKLPSTKIQLGFASLTQRVPNDRMYIPSFVQEITKCRAQQMKWQEISDHHTIQQEMDCRCMDFTQVLERGHEHGHQRGCKWWKPNNAQEPQTREPAAEVAVPISETRASRSVARKWLESL